MDLCIGVPREEEEDTNKSRASLVLFAFFGVTISGGEVRLLIDEV